MIPKSGALQGLHGAERVHMVGCEARVHACTCMDGFAPADLHECERGEGLRLGLGLGLSCSWVVGRGADARGRGACVCKQRMAHLSRKLERQSGVCPPQHPQREGCLHLPYVCVQSCCQQQLQAASAAALCPDANTAGACRRVVQRIAGLPCTAVACLYLHVARA